MKSLLSRTIIYCFCNLEQDLVNLKYFISCLSLKSLPPLLGKGSSNSEGIASHSKQLLSKCTPATCLILGYFLVKEKYENILWRGWLPNPRTSSMSFTRAVLSPYLPPPPLPLSVRGGPHKSKHIQTQHPSKLKCLLLGFSMEPPVTLSASLVGTLSHPSEPSVAPTPEISSTAENTIVGPASHCNVIL